jgi:hypothetical protein
MFAANLNGHLGTAGEQDRKRASFDEAARRPILTPSAIQIVVAALRRDTTCPDDSGKT